MAVEIAPKLFKNTGISQLYQECRPRYTESGVIEKILDFMRVHNEQPPYDRAADIGCGTGLSTQHLLPHFRDVVGIDASPSQIEEATRCNTAENVRFRVGSAEDLCMFEDASLDLLTVGTAIHYFNIDEFYKELDRVLKPGGVFAQFGYNHHHTRPGLSLADGFIADHPAREEVNEECNKVFQEIFTRFLDVGGYHPALDPEMYGVELPSGYVDQKKFSGEMMHPCNLTTLMGLLETLGLWQNYCTKSGTNSQELAEQYRGRFLNSLGRISQSSEDVPMEQHLTFYVILARKPSSGDRK